MQLYTELADALERARERSAANQSDDKYLIEILQMSSGVHKVTGRIVYRPFYAAAKWIQQSRRDQSITQAADVKFTGQVTPIESLLDLQRSLDFELDIKPEFMIFSRAATGALKANYDMAILALKQFQPRGYS